MKNGNFVAKYDWRVNKASVHKDRKKALKKGYRKHRMTLQKIDNAPNGAFFLLKAFL